jgi:16S rRNA (adenine1518-N6/adenine1519-N6)-dimethyltransferase
MKYPFYSINSIRSILTEKGGNPRKKWGQNFLINPNIIQFIINSMEVDSIKNSELIVEIGPGLGALTHRLIEFEKEIIAFEIDPIMIQILEEFSYNNVKIVKGDVIEQLHIVGNKNIYAVGNLPYYISSEILISLVKKLNHLNGGVFMLQKEFAVRIAKEISSLSIFLGAFGKWEIIHHIKGNNFYPAPNAVSSLLKYSPFESPLLIIEAIPILEVLLRGFFWGKRKTIDRLIIDSPFLTYLKEPLKNLILDFNLSGRERPEEIPRDLYYNMANKIVKDYMPSL